MKLRIKPTHAGLLAAMLMILAVVALAGIVAHDYAGRLTTGVADDIYQDPMLSIQVAATRIRTRLAAQTPLGDLDKLYEERVLSPLGAEPDEEDIDKPEGEDDTQQEVEFRVTGIAWSNRRPVAFINGQGVTIGDSVDGWRVTGIAQESVTLADDEGNRKQIGLYQGKAGKQDSKSRQRNSELGNDANF